MSNNSNISSQKTEYIEYINNKNKYTKQNKDRTERLHRRNEMKKIISNEVSHKISSINNTNYNITTRKSKNNMFFSL